MYTVHSAEDSGRRGKEGVCFPAFLLKKAATKGTMHVLRTQEQRRAQDGDDPTTLWYPSADGRLLATPRAGTVYLSGWRGTRRYLPAGVTQSGSRRGFSPRPCDDEDVECARPITIIIVVILLVLLFPLSLASWQSARRSLSAPGRVSLSAALFTSYTPWNPFNLGRHATLCCPVKRGLPPLSPCRRGNSGRELHGDCCRDSWTE